MNPVVAGSCWLVHRGDKGDAVQCEGVARSIGVEFTTKVVHPRPPWSWLAPRGPAAPEPDIRPPWPDLLIASGRHAIPQAIRVRRRSRGRTYTVILKNPRVALDRFDLVWIPRHDGVTGANVITTVTSPHPITAAALEDAADRFRSAFANLPRPLVGVLVGGASTAYRFDRPAAEQLADDLAAFAADHRAGLAITCSRRTGADNEALLGDRLRGPGAYVWDGADPNPYLAILALADILVVTCESANMVGEAAATGKPIYLYRLPGDSRRFDSFHTSVIDNGWARWFDGSLDRWRYAPVNATDDIAAAVRAGLERHFQERCG